MVAAPWCADLALQRLVVAGGGAGWMRIGGGAKQDGDGHGGSGWMRVTADL